MVRVPRRLGYQLLPCTVSYFIVDCKRTKAQAGAWVWDFANAAKLNPLFSPGWNVYYEGGCNKPSRIVVDDAKKIRITINQRVTTRRDPHQVGVPPNGPLPSAGMINSCDVILRVYWEGTLQFWTKDICDNKDSKE